MESKSRFLLFCGMVAPIILLSIIIVLGQITPNYDPISQTVSQMGTRESPYYMVLTIGYIMYGLLMVAAACGLSAGMGFSTRAKIITVLLGMHALSTALLGVFPDTLDIAPKRFPDDFMHNAISALSYIPLLIAMPILRGLSKKHRLLKVMGIIGMAVFILNLPMPVVTMLEPLKVIGGLLQRVLSGMSYLWLSVSFFILYFKSRQELEKELPHTPDTHIQDQSRTCPTASE